jgi:hypothetical protein
MAGGLCDTACQVNKDSFVAGLFWCDIISTLQAPVRYNIVT